MVRQPLHINRRSMNLFIRYTALLLCLATAPALAFEDKYLDANGVKLRYIDTGKGKAIVLLHGGGSNLESWTSQGVVDNLAKDFHASKLKPPRGDELRTNPAKRMINPFGMI